MYCTKTTLSPTYSFKQQDCNSPVEKYNGQGLKIKILSHLTRVGHHILFRSEHIVLLRSFKERNVLLRSFFEFLVTYETQKNDAFFCVLFLRT